MQFRRRNLAGKTFSGGGFRITRPSGRKVDRDGLDFQASDRDYDVRLDGEEIWLLEGDRLVGYAKGDSNEWRLLIDDRPYAIDQPKLGNNFSLVLEGERQVGAVAGAGFPLRLAEIDTTLDLSDEQRAFVVMIALLGWRESDRALLGNVPSDAR